MSDSTPTNNTSTVKAAIDSVTGTAQEMFGKVVGSSGDEAKGLGRQDKAQAENEASHATAKIPGFTASGAGAVTKDSDDRTKGQWDQTVGSAKETVGGLIGNQVRSFARSPVNCHPLRNNRLLTRRLHRISRPKAASRTSKASDRRQRARLPTTRQVWAIASRAPLGLRLRV